MSDTFGALYISGQQTGLPSGGQQGIGPFAIPASGVQDTQTVIVNTTATIPVPSGAQGVLLVPPVAGDVAWSFRTINGDTGTYLNQSLPSFIDFDPDNYPSNIHLNSASSVAITVQFI
jgi:hypothetical protein